MFFGDIGSGPANIAEEGVIVMMGISHHGAGGLDMFAGFGIVGQQGNLGGAELLLRLVEILKGLCRH